MGLMPQQINHILGELFCPFYFILGTFFKTNKHTQVTTFFYPFVLNIISPMHRLHLFLPSKHTQPKTDIPLSLQMVFKLIQVQNTRKSGNYGNNEMHIHTDTSSYKLKLIF